MRVYEIAKELGVSNKEILEAFAGKGIELHGHMAALSEEQVNMAQSLFKDKRQKKGSVGGKVGKKEVATSAEKNELVLKPMTVAELAERIDKPAGGIILTLLHKGIVCAKNQLLSEDDVVFLAEHYEVPVSRAQSPVRKLLQKEISKEKGGDKRLPVVVVVGHVDHGKTTLLDFIRKTRVVAKEKGGITQHLGAYEAQTSHGKIVFLDTPGHEAFSRIRARGIGVADVVVLVIAADDGIMPQTVEAIKYAKELAVPIIVAINKIDRVDKARIEVVKRELAQYDLLPEEWGGDVVCVPVSAKEGAGVEHLLEMIALHSEMLELKADASRPAQGYVLESNLEKGRGPVATVIGRHGTLKVGDSFCCGGTCGKVNSLVNSYGKRLESVGPSIPTVVAGFASLPEVGDFFEVVPAAGLKRERSADSCRLATDAACSLATKGTLVLIVKTDTNSTKEALLDSIQKVVAKDKGRKVNVIQAEAGDISESNVALAGDVGAIIFGLHVKVGPKAAVLAQKKNVQIVLSGIIYKLLEELDLLLEKRKEVKKVKRKTGEAIVRKVFDIKGAGTIAGAYVKDGLFSQNGEVVVWRRDKKLGGGKIKSLQRDRKIVKEVHKGFECAFIIEDYVDWQVDDRVECFIEVPESS